jgi:protein-S-isoprenylcysteine O-methyltransferase Ste14
VNVEDVVFRIVLPVFWLWLVLGIAANRRLLLHKLGRDPIVIRPGQRPDTPAEYLARAFSICALLFTVDVALNAVSPAVVADTLAIEALRSSKALGGSGLALLTVGLVLTFVAVRQMGLSWRIGIDNQAPGPLVSRGLFSRIRHPIYGGMLLASAGLACVTADLLSVAVAAAAWLGLPVQARLEEAFLLSRYPDEYRNYVEQTGRFWPRVP